MRHETPLKTIEIKFTDGVEFIDESVEDRKVKSYLKSEGLGKLVQEQRDFSSNKLLTTIVREVTADNQKLIIVI